METNYCTHWFKGTWNHCCKLHDKCYDLHNKPRSLCDIKFYLCVRSSSILGRLLAFPMYLMVKKFGVTYYNKKQLKTKDRIIRDLLIKHKE